jgi:hypothetical protein
MGWVDNILKVFNFMNMTLDVDGRRVDARGIAHFAQKLNMRHTAFGTEFYVAGKLHVKYRQAALRPNLNDGTHRIRLAGVPVTIRLGRGRAALALHTRVLRLVRRHQRDGLLPGLRPLGLIPRQTRI